MTVNVGSTAGQWVRHVSDDGSELKDMPKSGYRCTTEVVVNEERWIK
jgi:hypothetical protein